ncbi:CoA pyrophosphatase [Salinisphaera sp. T31B1]|uniref:NUDIX hydrolase n=1 Tax=Salinisphaera sp. T31B1 TaxID=727963 RepID=UPI0033400B2B
MHELSPLITALARHRPRRQPLRRHLQRAAVAVILRETRQGGEVLLIERAQRAGDPWSGHMALPGGRLERADRASGSTAARRETAEEIGLALDSTHGVGRLSDRLTLDHRRRGALVLSPFVYRYDNETCLYLNHEIADTCWVALADLDEPGRRGTLSWRIGPVALPMPCHPCDHRRVIWGLTLQILDELLRIADRGRLR